MPKKPLLLSPANLPAWPGRTLAAPSWATAVRWGATLIGLIVVLVGAADVTSRLARAALGQEALFNAFAPAAAIVPTNGPLASSTAMGPLVPARIKIPALGIDARIEEVGKKVDGSMGTPKDFLNAGWWSLGAKPGQPGNTVIDGHVNNALTKAGIFEHLSQIHVGDYITVSDAQGKTRIYKVSEVNLYPTSEAPAASIFATTGPSQLVLITCDGEWVQDEHSFNKRLVVIARPA